LKIALPESFMSVEELERQIRKLRPPEVSRLARLILELEQENWDQQLEADSTSGRLDFVFEEAEEERRHGELKPWPRGE
jgi:hypothetical protein